MFHEAGVGWGARQCRRDQVSGSVECEGRDAVVFVDLVVGVQLRACLLRFRELGLLAVVSSSFFSLRGVYGALLCAGSIEEAPTLILRRGKYYYEATVEYGLARVPRGCR